jgi:predicted nucleic acid-binding protein
MALTDLFLVDKSALARVDRHPAAREAFFALDETGTLATCAIIDLEIGYSARNLAAFESVSANRADLYVDLPVTRAVGRRAREVQRELARRGQHRGPGIPDLIIAACAELHEATVVHYDRDFEMIAGITGQPVRWLVPAGSAD